MRKKNLLVTVLVAVFISMAYYFMNMGKSSRPIVDSPKITSPKKGLSEPNEVAPKKQGAQAPADEVAVFTHLGHSMTHELGRYQWSNTELDAILTAASAGMQGAIQGKNPIEFIFKMQNSIEAREAAMEKNEPLEPLGPEDTEALGFILAMQSPINPWKPSKEEQQAFLDGVRLGLSNQKPAQTFSEESIEAFIQKRTQQIETEMQKEITANREKNAAFLAELVKDPAVKEEAREDGSGFYYKIIEPGQGPHPKDTDTVNVHYHGTLTNGTVFDSSKDRNEPISFGMGQVIKAFSGGLSKIGAGGRVMIYAPPGAAYGDRAAGKIPPSSLLIFDCELLAIE